jgi:amidohydrolase
MFVGVGQPGTPDGPGLHHPAFLPPEETVGDVARAMLAGYVAACSAGLQQARGAGTAESGRSDG